MAKMAMDGRARGPFTGKKLDKGTLKRLLKILFTEYKGIVSVFFIMLLISSVCASINGIFLNKVYKTLQDYTGPLINNANPNNAQMEIIIGAKQAWNQIVLTLSVLAGVYLTGLIANFIFNRVGAVLTQRFLRDMRNKLFAKMQTLPIKYFDRNHHGDIMSTYTNDVDALRQLISQSIPQLCSTIITLIVVGITMLYLSVSFTVAVVIGVIIIIFVTKVIGGNSAKFFMAQQQAVGAMEGYVEEMMHGQKVVKVFCHEEESKKKMAQINGHLYNVSYKANAFSNMLMPIIHNIGNVMYVLIAFLGGGLLIFGKGNALNFSFESLFINGSFATALKVDIFISFLGMSRHFANTLGQISGQINSVVMGMAGASRIFNLLDQESEDDNGYVTLVNACEDENGNITESCERTGIWAWKHPHGDGTLTYTKLKGDIVLDDVDFGYTEEKIVLHNISLYANAGQR